MGRPINNLTEKDISNRMETQKNLCTKNNDTKNKLHIYFWIYHKLIWSLDCQYNLLLSILKRENSH